MGIKWSSGNFLNATNNRAECINAKLKGIVERYSSQEDFATNFFCFVYTIRKEREHKAAALLQKIRVRNGDKDLEQYCELLTPYALKYVERHVHLSSRLPVNTNSEATASDCTCGFRKAMLLPCCHTLAARSQLGLSKFGHSLCVER